MEAVLIGGMTFDIENASQIEDDADGRIEFTSARILLSNRLAPSYRRVVMWHEIVHGILDLSGQGEHSRNEGLVDSLANGIAQVLRDNPQLRE